MKVVVFNQAGLAVFELKDNHSATRNATSANKNIHSAKSGSDKIVVTIVSSFLRSVPISRLGLKLDAFFHGLPGLLTADAIGRDT